MKPEIKAEDYVNGQRRYEIPYVNRQKHGLETWWNFNGQKECEIPYVNGQAHGLSKGWYENGKKKYEISYVNGQAHGLEKWWHFNGPLRILTKWHQNQRVWTMRFSSTEQIPTDAEVELFF